jgi:hypothetical protein
MSSDTAFESVLDPEPSAAEREAARLALARLARPELRGSRDVSAWRAAGLSESAEGDAQDAAPRSRRGATRA